MSIEIECECGESVDMEDYDLRDGTVCQACLEDISPQYYVGDIMAALLNKIEELEAKLAVSP